jgi:hypothetical protein
MLHDRTRSDFIQALALQAISFHHAAHSGRQHVLIAYLRIGSIAACERNAYAAYDCDGSRGCSDQHRYPLVIVLTAPASSGEL